MDLNDIAKSLVMDADPIQTDQQDQVDAADAEILTDEQPENQVEEMDNDEAEDEFEETDPNAEEVDAFTLTIDDNNARNRPKTNIVNRGRYFLFC